MHLIFQEFKLSYLFLKTLQKLGRQHIRQLIIWGPDEKESKLRGASP